MTLYGSMGFVALTGAVLGLIALAAFPATLALTLLINRLFRHRVIRSMQATGAA